MSKINFILGIHNHQPVGNFDHVFEQAYKRSYEPFLKVALDHPHVRFSLHTTGCLWEWLEKHERGYFDLVGKLLEQKQIELLGGAFYEPILPILPRNDALEQFERMRDYLKKRFGVTPRGAWLAERVWEPALASLLAEARVEYLPLDDYHFLSAGHPLHDLSGYYLTESNSPPVALFPIHQALRYAIPFKEPERTLNYFREQAQERENAVFVMADDGEKFGLWPKTYEWVYEQGWLHRFFDMLETHGDEIQLMTFSEARDQIPAAGRTYLPTCSYFEMGEWVLPSQPGRNFEKFVKEFESRSDWDELKPFLKGGFWRGFLAKYPESNYLHKRMLRSSRKYYRLSGRKRNDDLHTPLLRGQCNCAYWHGVFGGLYLPHLRHAVWKELLHSEYLSDNLLHRGRKWVDIEYTDHDTDGHKEVLIENARMNAYLSPRRGGSLFEWDDRAAGYNLLDTLTRQPESYHEKLIHAVSVDAKSEGSASIHDLVLSKERDLDQKLFYDRWPRAALLDHFPGWNSLIGEFQTGKLADYGTFLKGEYRIAEMFTDGVKLACLGWVGETSVEILKTIRAVPGKPILNIHYRVKNHSDFNLDSPFGVEWNLGLKAANSFRHHISIPDSGDWNQPLGEIKVHQNVKEVRLADDYEGVAVHLSLDGAAKLWRVPIESISLSEGGFERVFQSIALMFLWDLHLAPRQSWERNIVAQLANP